MNTLKQKLCKYIEEHGLNPTSFSRKASISPGIITHIISSDSTNPTIDTALKIAKLMNCSLDELFDREYLSGNIIINQKLLNSISDHLCTIKIMQGKTLDDFFNIIRYIYDYCSENKLEEADKNFINWYISKIYNK